jgi:plasmid stabilization system protein ParE
VTISFALEAEEDFRALIEYIAERDPKAAASLGDRIFAIIDQLAAGDFDGPEVKLSTGESVQSWAAPPVRLLPTTQRRALDPANLPSGSSADRAVTN